MKTIKVFVVALFMMGFGNVFAQQTAGMQPKPKMENREARMEKFKAMKVEYLTSELNLSAEEAERFWPIYNEFMEKKRALEKARMMKLKKMREKESLTDKEVTNMIQMNFDTEQEILDLRREYDLLFKEVLSIQQVGKLYVAEQQFKREVMRKMKQKPQTHEMAK